MSLKETINTLLNKNQILRNSNIRRKCDLCDSPMPPSGGTLTSAALKELVKAGFNFQPKIKPMDILREHVENIGAPPNTLRSHFHEGLLDYLEQNEEEIGISRHALVERMKKNILDGKAGNWSLCPSCFENVITLDETDSQKVEEKKWWKFWR